MKVYTGLLLEPNSPPFPGLRSLPRRKLIVKDLYGPPDQNKAAEWLGEEAREGKLDGVSKEAELIALLPGSFSHTVTVLSKDIIYIP